MSKPVWFQELFGFTEGGSFTANRDKFSMDGEVLVCPSAPEHKRMHVGPFEFASVGELRERLASFDSQSQTSDPHAEGKHTQKGLTFRHQADPVGVVSLIMNPDNAGSVFQAASQFNCLEMVGPGVSPARGIAIYFDDPTQGPKCALSCPAGTVYRNYLVNDGKGQGSRQLDGLAEVGKVLGNNLQRADSKQSLSSYLLIDHADRTKTKQPCEQNLDGFVHQFAATFSLVVLFLALLLTTGMQKGFGLLLC